MFISSDGMTLSFGRKLTTMSLEAELSRHEKLVQSASGTTRPNFLQVDLSQLEWADLGAVAQLTLLILRHSLHAGKIDVLLPTRGGSAAQDASPLHDARNDALRFLEYLRFPDCVVELRADSTAEINVSLDGMVWSRETASDSGSTYKRVIPLRWMSLEDSESRELQAGNIVAAAENVGMGLDAFDARALSNVILYELIENVADHATPSGRALICGIAHRHVNMQLMEDFVDAERPYLSMLNQNGQRFIEIIVGDAGVGIVATLDKSYRRVEGGRKGNLTKRNTTLPYRVVKWAFDRWSSAKDENRERRGVRGLFRVDRIVAKYQGLISVRTDRTFFVRDHASFGFVEERYRKEPKAHPKFDGTLLRLRLIPRSDLKPRLHFAAASRLTDGKVPVNAVQPTVQTIYVGAPDGTHISTTDKELILAAMAISHSRPDFLMVVFSRAFHSNKTLVENSLDFLAQHASPVPIFAVNLGISDEELALSVGSVNEQLGKQTTQAGIAAGKHESSDLFAVMSIKGNIYWCGIPTEMAERLNACTNESDRQSEQREELVNLSAMIPMFFNIDPILDSPKQVRLKPKWEFSLLLKEIEKPLSDYIKKATTSAGIYRGGTFLTPTMLYINTWIDSVKFVNSLPATFVDGLIFSLCARLFQQVNRGDSKLLLLCTPWTSNQMREGIVRTLPFIKEIDPQTTFAEISFPHLSQIAKEVLIYSDVVSSEESSRQAAQFARDHGLKVSGMACLIDTRNDTDTAALLQGENFSLISLLHYPTKVNFTERPRAISPSHMWEEPDDLASQLGYQKDPLLETGSSLTFGHLKRPNGRHLTLTVDVENFLNTQKLISFVRDQAGELWEKVNRKCKSPLPIAVWVPVDKRDNVVRHEAIATLFSQAINSDRYKLFILTKISLDGSTVFNPASVSYDKDKYAGLLVFDWGAISGATIHSLVNLGASRGADFISVLIASTQLAPHEIQFLESVSKLAAVRQSPALDLLSESSYSSVEVSVEFRHFSALSLGQFSQYECPVCRQAEELSHIPDSVAFLDDYVKSEIARLGRADPIDFPLEGREKRWLWIGRMRHGLELAKISTVMRKYIYDEILALRKASVGKDGPCIEAIALLELLYVEQQWLKIAPLNFRIFRNLVADICWKLIQKSGGALQTIAISVLRRASKMEFISKSPEILHSLSNNRLAQQALLSGIHSYIARDYHQVGNLEPLADTVKAIEALIFRENGPPGSFSECKAAISYLDMQVKFLKLRANPDRISRPRLLSQLIKTLRTDYKPHSAAATASTRLTSRAFSELLMEVCNSSHDVEGKSLSLMHQVESKRRNWKTCRTFLLTQVIPLLVNLEEEFSSQTFRQHCEDVKDSSWLRHIIERHRTGLASMDLDKTLDIIENFVKSGCVPENKEEALSALEEFNVEVEFIAHVILRAEKSTIETDTRAPMKTQDASAVSKFLGDFPADIEEVIARAQHDVPEVVLERDVALMSGVSNEVYCPSELLIRTLGEILENTKKYASSPMVRLSVQEDGDAMCLHFSNEVSAQGFCEKTPEGHGLGQCRSELESFDGGLSSSRKGERFIVEVIVKKWEDS